MFKFISKIVFRLFSSSVKQSAEDLLYESLQANRVNELITVHNKILNKRKEMSSKARTERLSYK
jgi:hypothetical protein